MALATTTRAAAGISSAAAPLRPACPASALGSRCCSTSSASAASVASPLAPQRAHRRGAVAVLAAKLPAGVTVPPRQPDMPPPTFGFVHFAEKINGRAAMLGFFALLLVEGVANRGLLELMGMQVGKGLGFEL